MSADNCSFGSWMFRGLGGFVNTLEGAVFLAMGASVLKDGDASISTYAGIGALGGLLATAVSSYWMSDSKPATVLLPLLPMLGTTALSALMVSGPSVVSHAVANFAVGAAIGVPTLVAPVAACLWCCKKGVQAGGEYYSAV